MKQPMCQQTTVLRPTACPRCRGHLLWQRDEETWTCFTCGWRWYPGVPLPLSRGAGLRPAASHLAETPESKKCPGCGQTLPAAKFYERQGSRDGLERLCRRCKCEYDRDRRRRKVAL